jgi:hypothetical protein
MSLFFFSEYGCNTPNRSRDFSDIPVMFGPKMMGIFSGGFIFEYSEEVNSFGLGYSYYSNKSFVPLQDYFQVKKQFSSINPTGPKLNEFVSKGTKKECPTPNGVNWLAKSYPLPLTPNNALCDCLTKKFTCRTIERDPRLITPELGEKIGDAFQYVCSKYPEMCTSVTNDPVNANYGNHSACDALVAVSIVMTNYFNKFPTEDSCTFNGIAEIVEPENDDENCEDYKFDYLEYSSTASVSSQDVSSGDATSSQGGSSSTRTSSNFDPSTEDEESSNDSAGIMFCALAMILIFLI